MLTDRDEVFAIFPEFNIVPEKDVTSSVSHDQEASSKDL